ncbi:MAG: hypothetical protein JWR07_1627 [Nevskia sp.]|nr:hypothetical protein [Nevskia sp.]
MNLSLLLHPALAPALMAEGSTRPFILSFCARLAYAALALLQPDFVIAAALVLAALRKLPLLLAGAARTMPGCLAVQRWRYA